MTAFREGRKQIDDLDPFVHHTGLDAAGIPDQQGDVDGLFVDPDAVVHEPVHEERFAVIADDHQDGVVEAIVITATQEIQRRMMERGCA